MIKSDYEVITELEEILTRQRYSPVVVRNYCSYARDFADHLAHMNILIADVTEAQVKQYLCEAVALFQRRHGRLLGPRWHQIPCAGIIATKLDDGRHALGLYRRRWGIECMFVDAKTRGLNLEDTHITDPTKLATLLMLIALAVTWACRSATRVIGREAIRRKRNGRREKSWFRTGLDALRKWIIHYPHHAPEARTNRYLRGPLTVSQ